MLEVIWVPDSGTSGLNRDSASPMANELLLFVLGFIVLSLSAACGSLLIDGEVVKTADKFGMVWVIDLLSVLPWFGYLFATTGALVGVTKSNAQMSRRLIWFFGTQIVAAGLWFASSLH